MAKRAIALDGVPPYVEPEPPHVEEPVLPKPRKPRKKPTTGWSYLGSSWAPPAPVVAFEPEPAKPSIRSDDGSDLPSRVQAARIAWETDHGRKAGVVYLGESELKELRGIVDDKLWSAIEHGAPVNVGGLRVIRCLEIDSCLAVSA